MPNREIVVTLSEKELRMIAKGFESAADSRATVQVMIQNDGVKFKLDYGSWTPPMGKVEK